MEVGKYIMQLGHAPSQVTEKAYFHLAKAFNTPFCLANAEEQACELFILRDKGAKKGLKKKKR